MNVHHLELFYFVARHRGVSAATRHIPYGIQQPAISAQIIQLEDSLGTTLFHRRPFELTPAGKELFTFIEPFFQGLPRLEEKLRGGEQVCLRIGAPESIQMYYLPTLLHQLKAQHKALEFNLVSARQDELERMLLAQEIDMAFSAIHSKLQAGIHFEELTRLHMALMVTSNHGLKRPDQLWQQDRIEAPLITVNATDPMCLHFQQGLQRRKIEWYPMLELNSLDLVHRYAAEGFGIGLVPLMKSRALPPNTRLIPLSDFPQVPYAALWIGKLSPLQQELLDAARTLASSV